MKFFQKTRTILFAALAVMGVATLASCDSEQLSARQAKKAIQKSPAFRDSTCTGTFSTGYYEVGEAERTGLRQLEKAKMITCKFDTIIEKKKHTHYNWYGPNTYSYTDVEHIYATVDFTEEGREYVVTNVPTVRKDEEKDMKLLEKEEEEVLPDFMDLSVPEEAEEAEEAAVDTVAADSVVEAETVEPVVEEEKEAKSAYELAREKENKTTHSVLLGEWNVVKVKEVFCPEELRKQGKGSCVVICEFSDKTPFGWVEDYMKEGERIKANVDLRYYDDMGWLVEDFKEVKFKESK